MRLKRFLSSSRAILGINVLSDAGETAGIPILYKHITSFRDFVMIKISPFSGNCL